ARLPLYVAALEQFVARLGAHLRADLLSVILAGLAVLILVQELIRLQLGVAGLDDDVRLEVEDPFQIAERDVEQMADAARQPLEEPDMADRRRQRDVPQPLAPHVRLCGLDARTCADN